MGRGRAGDGGGGGPNKKGKVGRFYKKSKKFISERGLLFGTGE